jgi:hypothetical protein
VCYLTTLSIAEIYGVSGTWINYYVALVNWYWQGKRKYLEKTCHSAILFSIPDGLAWDQTEVFVVTSMIIAFSVNSIANSEFSLNRMCALNTDNFGPGTVKCMVQVPWKTTYLVWGFHSVPQFSQGHRKDKNKPWMVLLLHILTNHMHSFSCT